MRQSMVGSFQVASTNMATTLIIPLAAEHLIPMTFSPRMAIVLVANTTQVALVNGTLNAALTVNGMATPVLYPVPTIATQTISPPIALGYGIGMTQPQLTLTVTCVTVPTSGTLAARVLLDDLPIPQGSLVDWSGAIVVAETSQTIFPQNFSRRYLFIQNTSQDTLWIDFCVPAIDASPSIALLAGQSITMADGFVSTDLVTIFGPIVGDTFTAKEG